jgi:hypothetical protein
MLGLLWIMGTLFLEMWLRPQQASFLNTLQDLNQNSGTRRRRSSNSRKADGCRHCPPTHVCPLVLTCVSTSQGICARGKSDPGLVGWSTHLWVSGKPHGETEAGAIRSTVWCSNSIFAWVQCPRLRCLMWFKGYMYRFPETCFRLVV